MTKALFIKPALAEHFKKMGIPKFQYGHKHVIRPAICHEILKKLELKSKYSNSKRLDIIDVFPGYGLFSSILNQELKPNKHIIVEDSKENVEIWKDRIEYLQKETGNEENFILFPKNGFKWETFDEILQKKIIEPKYESREKVHDELLIVGNLTTQKFGESLLAQWIMCSVYQNWLQKYGRVRMICFIPDVTAQKFWSGAHFNKRNKSAIKRELFTDSHLIAVSEVSDNLVPNGNDYDPNLIMKDQPYLIPLKSILPVGASLAVVEIVPTNRPDLDFDMLEYILQILMYRSTGKLSDALSQLAPGADIDLIPKIPKEILNKCPRDLLTEEFLLVYDVFNNWAFKPSFTDTIGIFQEDTRTF
ncbi:uncharacterized protein PRCAT00001201001 [Priceomyces carsonii]|uniref:uncharacterized protein n=1 Tax=Priceomyces carsonii TaxID=28549 RepID=UPI002EDAB8FE|nr:unnamed protein product [Priceomyces carsonii]